MKKVIIGLCLAAIFAGGCTQGNKYEVTGTWPGGDGNVVYISRKLAKDNYLAIDSTVVAGGAFTMKGTVPEIDKYTLRIGRSDEEIMLDGVPVTVTVTSEQHENRKGEMVTSNRIAVSGSPEQQILRDGRAMATGKSMIGLGALFMMAEVKDDPHKLDSIYKVTEELKAESEKSIRRFFDSLNDSYAVTYMIGDFIAREYPFADVERYYANLTPRMKGSYPGKLLEEKISALRDISIGGTAPEIDLPGPDGNNVKLSSLKGKYVLLDFWASWCGPCLREVPNVKAIYDDYRDKGFEVYGVSVDDGKQRDAWLAKIEEYGMDWVHVSDLKGWESPVVRRYNVTGIPKMFLLDRDGRIIAADLRGEALRQKVASLFE